MSYIEIILWGIDMEGKLYTRLTFYTIHFILSTQIWFFFQILMSCTSSKVFLRVIENFGPVMKQYFYSRTEFKYILSRNGFNLGGAVVSTAAAQQESRGF